MFSESMLRAELGSEDRSVGKILVHLGGQSLSAELPSFKSKSRGLNNI